MNKKWDVIIIGSGPAGSVCGYQLAKEKIKTLLIEKKKIPRDKICSGLVSKESQNALKKIGLRIPDAVCTRPKIGKGIKVQFYIGNNFFEMPEKFYNVWRRYFDFWLTLEANKMGVNVKDETKLIDIKKLNDDILIKVKTKDEITGKYKIEEYITKYLVGADGAASTVRKLIYPNFKRSIGIAYQEYWRGTIDLDPRYFYAFMDRELSAGYAFCNMKEDYLIIGVGALKGIDIKNFQNRFIRYLQDGWNLNLEKFIRREATVTTDIFSENPVFNHLHGEDNILLIGEAADLFNVMGEGIPSAIKSAINASEAIKENINNSKTDVIELYKEKNKKLVEKLEKNWEGFKKQYDQFSKI